jgi:multiple sugar transport system permease protein
VTATLQSETEGAPPPPPLTKSDKKKLSQGARAEERLGWMLCLPAVIVLLAVAAAPMGYAIYLSLERYDLRFPHLQKFIGFSNYGVVLGNTYWWKAFIVTAIITVVSVVIEFVLGMTFALIMHRTLVGKGLIRTLILIPYGLVTVVAAYGWQYAWTPNEGYLANLVTGSHAPLANHYQSIALIILAEVWKTTPFMALLLLAGLSLVSEDLLSAAILVAVLFRTLDAFRVFDNIYILTSGSQNTASVSFLAYDNLFTGLNLGLGSTISVLIFLAVAIIAFIFVKLFGASAPGSEL